MKIDFNDPYQKKVFDFLDHAPFRSKYYLPDIVKKENEELFTGLVCWYTDVWLRPYASIGWSWVDEHTLYRDNYVRWVLDEHPEYRPFLLEHLPYGYKI